MQLVEPASSSGGLLRRSRSRSTCRSHSAGINVQVGRNIDLHLGHRNRESVGAAVSGERRSCPSDSTYRLCIFGSVAALLRVNVPTLLLTGRAPSEPSGAQCSPSLVEAYRSSRARRRFTNDGLRCSFAQPSEAPGGDAREHRNRTVAGGTGRRGPSRRRHRCRLGLRHPTPHRYCCCCCSPTSRPSQPGGAIAAIPIIDMDIFLHVNTFRRSSFINPRD